MTAATVALSLSVVSHGQGALVSCLLDDLSGAAWNCGLAFEVIVTLNIAEEEGWLRRPFPFPLIVIRNTSRKGFGANHNAAFQTASGGLFAVVNPDIRLGGFRLDRLLVGLTGDQAGVCGPVVLAPDGGVEDSARYFPSFGKIVARRFGRSLDYEPSDSVRRVDWIAGMFMLFPSAVYRAIGGFDERYFMYLEDVEVCRRLHQRGLDVIWVGSTTVIHDAARASARSARHLRWHLTSLLRYYFASR